MINLKTAKALGLQLPGTLLARADEVGPSLTYGDVSFPASIEGIADI